MRHEIGHYCWERIIHDRTHVESFRKLFGDQATASRSKPATSRLPFNWPEHFVSAYASGHPSEDWAETGAHYFT